MYQSALAFVKVNRMFLPLWTITALHGLVLGTTYSFTVSAYNCRNQEGARDTFIVQPQGNHA